MLGLLVALATVAAGIVLVNGRPRGELKGSDTDLAYRLFWRIPGFSLDLSFKRNVAELPGH